MPKANTKIQHANLAGTPWTYTANNLNQYSAFTKNQVAETPSYDDDGNMLTRDGWVQTWNAENRLIKAEKGTAKLEFAYDYMGRRIFRKVYSNGTLTSHIRFVYDGYKLMEELDALNNNAVLRRYAWSPVGLDVPVSVYDAVANSTCYYHTDANKNITELTNASGSVVAHYEYSPFGKVVVSAGTYANTNPFRFSSEYHDDETGLVYYNYRYYSPELGRWLSRDPIEEKGGINLGLIVSNSPLSKIDNLGLAGTTTHGTHSCDRNDNCGLLAAKTREWMKHYAERYRELRIDKYNYRITDPKKYNNHIVEIDKASMNIRNCIRILNEKIEKCQCGEKHPRVPEFTPKPVPQPIPIEYKSDRTIKWENVGPFLTYSVLTVALAAIPFDGPVGEMATASIAIGYFVEIY